MVQSAEDAPQSLLCNQFNVPRSWCHGGHLKLRTEPPSLPSHAGHRLSETSTFYHSFLHLETMDMDSPWWLRWKTAVNCSAKDPTGGSAFPFVLSADVKPYTVSYFSLPGDQINITYIAC